MPASSQECSLSHNRELIWRGGVASIIRRGLTKETAMERDELLRTQSRDIEERDEARRNEALARYDAHPSIAIWLLAAMAFLFIVATYQFVADRIDQGPRSDSARTQTVQPGVRGN